MKNLEEKMREELLERMSQKEGVKLDALPPHAQALFNSCLDRLYHVHADLLALYNLFSLERPSHERKEAHVKYVGVDDEGNVKENGSAPISPNSHIVRDAPTLEDSIRAGADFRNRMISYAPPTKPISGIRVDDATSIEDDDCPNGDPRDGW